MKLWIDDERLPGEGWYFATTSKAGIEMLSMGPWEEISLDHDLGGDDTGMKVLDYMVEHGIWPQVLTIHTANPPARDAMLRAANAEAPDWVAINVLYW